MNALVFHRLQHRLHRRGLALPARFIQRLIFLLFNSSVPPETEIGEGTRFAYGGMGLVIHPKARIGRNAFIGHQVTIGGRSLSDEMPVIEDGVYIATGARVLGPIRVGSGSYIGANAVVIRDVEPNCVVAGVPARVLRRNSTEARDTIALIIGGRAA
jgi:serine O-acetyltransferase